MLILAIDTTANTASCSLSKDGKLLSLFTVNGTLTHSETMLPMIEDMINKSSIKLSDIDAFAVANCPGSFTGVRIGVSLIKGLAFNTGKVCVGVSALEALAENLSGFDSYVVPVMDARRNQVYTAIFKNGERILDDMLVPLDELKNKLSELNIKEIMLVGDGYSLAFDYFSKSDIKIKNTPEILTAHNAFTVAIIAEKMIAYRQTSDDLKLSAGYLRASQAERELIEKNNK